MTLENLQSKKIWGYGQNEQIKIIKIFFKCFYNLIQNLELQG